MTSAPSFPTDCTTGNLSPLSPDTDFIAFLCLTVLGDVGRGLNEEVRWGDGRDTWEQEEGVWTKKRKEQADEWEEEAGLREQVTDDWQEEVLREQETDEQQNNADLSEQEANSMHMENNGWEEDNQEAMEEERYITVLHDSLRREENEKV